MRFSLTESSLQTPFQMSLFVGYLEMPSFLELGKENWCHKPEFPIHSLHTSLTFSQTKQLCVCGLAVLFVRLVCVYCFFFFIWSQQPGNRMWGKTIRLQANSSAYLGQRLCPSCRKQRETAEKRAAPTRPDCVQAAIQFCTQPSKVFVFLGLNCAESLARHGSR